MVVSLLGLVISLFAYMLAFPNEHQKRFDIYLALLALHILGAVAFWLQTFESAMDAFLYYRDPFGFVRDDPFTDGTHFIVHFVQGVKTNLGGSFFDHFLLFQCFGMIGMALLIRSLNEVAASLGVQVPIIVYLTLFLPGLHFWTAGIGKDGPMMMAISIALWSSIHVEKRFPWLALALAIMLAVRPQITPFVMAGIVGSVLISKRTTQRLKLALAPLAAVGLVLFMFRAAESMNMDSLSFEGVSAFIDRQQGFSEEYGSGNRLDNQLLPIKVFSLMFRPFWIDAGGMMGYVASAENTILLFFCLYLLYNWKVLWELSRNVFVVGYCCIYAPLVIVSLSLVNYNIGLGQRMKMMAVPAILMLVGTIYMYNFVRSRHPRNLAQPPQEHPGTEAVTAQA